MRMALGQYRQVVLMAITIVIHYNLLRVELVTITNLWMPLTNLWMPFTFVVPYLYFLYVSVVKQVPKLFMPSKKFLNKWP